MVSRSIGSSARLAFPLLLAACGGTTLYAGANQVSTLAPPEAYDCAKTQFQSLGYATTSHDDDARRLIGQKRDTVTHISSVQIRKLYDQLEVEVKKNKTANSNLVVLAHSFTELGNAGGVQREERRASDQVQTDAVALLKNCGGAAE